jgi:hypothetical protein
MVLLQPGTLFVAFRASASTQAVGEASRYAIAVADMAGLDWNPPRFLRADASKITPELLAASFDVERVVVSKAVQGRSRLLHDAVA